MGVELTFASSLTGLLSHLGLYICKAQDPSHSDTTPLFMVLGEIFQGEKTSIYYINELGIIFHQDEKKYI